MLPLALPSPPRPQGPAVAVVKSGQVWAGLSFGKSPGPRAGHAGTSVGSRGRGGDWAQRAGNSHRMNQQGPGLLVHPGTSVSSASGALCTGPTQHRCPAPGLSSHCAPPAAPRSSQPLLQECSRKWPLGLPLLPFQSASKATLGTCRCLD